MVDDVWTAPSMALSAYADSSADTLTISMKEQT
jgi:hypothetical protein